jgi:hypothetical protein
MIVRLSRSALDLYAECPRCFWFDKERGVKRPESIWSTLNGGYKYSIRAYLDACRDRGLELPPQLIGRVDGVLANRITIKRIRGKSFSCQMGGIIFSGEFEDALEASNGDIVPLINVFRGFPVTEKGLSPAYQNKADAFSLLLRENNMRVSEYAYIVIWYMDHKQQDFARPFDFHLEVHKVETFPENTTRQINNAIMSLESSEPPESGYDLETGEKCSYCTFRETNNLISGNIRINEDDERKILDENQKNGSKEDVNRFQSIWEKMTGEKKKTRNTKNIRENTYKSRKQRYLDAVSEMETAREKTILDLGDLLARKDDDDGLTTEKPNKIEEIIKNFKSEWNDGLDVIEELIDEMKGWMDEMDGKDDCVYEEVSRSYNELFRFYINLDSPDFGYCDDEETSIKGAIEEAISDLEELDLASYNPNFPDIDQDEENQMRGLN